MNKQAAVVGNEEQMAKVKELMATSQQINQGGDYAEGVPIDFEAMDGTRYTGVVEFKRPTMQDYMKMGALKAQILGANGFIDLRMLDDTVKYMAQIMATLSVVTVKAPAWLVFNGRIDPTQLKNPELAAHLFDQYEEWEESFRKPVPSAEEGHSEPTNGTEDVDA